MKIKILRKTSILDGYYEYNIPFENKTALEVLTYVKEYLDPTLSFRYGCRSGVCGSCALLVNNKEQLSCKVIIKENDVLQVINNVKVIKDFIFDLNHEEKVIKQADAFLHKVSRETITKRDVEKIEKQSDCILCQICYSSCPVYSVNNNFIGPYALTRVLRYVEDKKEDDPSESINLIQNDGIWDCTLCGNCSMVCPQYIDSKNDILNLRMKSVQNGYDDPSIKTFTNDFDMGFNPNGF